MPRSAAGGHGPTAQLDHRYKDAHGRMKQVALGGRWPAILPHEAAASWQAQRTLRDMGRDAVSVMGRL
ncbi:MAG: hypothetical protein DI563_04735 [Variovorax paradoxus]|uniref:Uncharacterized protein n=1 Tax=Variovorax paradoxus TaxID=34073 RepID=A0A2W5QIV8_VARPD|nr:MAG: hypothetical protein DI563_04735 [Variovorax paradoxus]